MEQLLLAGMNVARLNFSHGDFGSHGQVLADPMGPNMRIGKPAAEPVQLVPGQIFTLTTADLVGDTSRASVSFRTLPDAL
jgi:pyruvate kinase